MMSTKQTVCRSTVLSRAAGGFTLIELLVVIGIIGILAAILLPALAKAKAQGYNAVCKNNLHQTGLGLQMYADDNRETYPVEFWLTANSHGTWKELLLPYDKMAITNASSHCPIYMQNHGFTGESHLGLEPGDSRWGSYAINANGMETMETVAIATPPLGLCGIYGWEVLVKESQVIAPSEMYAISDTRQFPILPGNGGGDDVSGVQVGSSVGTSWLAPWSDEPLAMFGADGVAHEFPPPHAQGYNVVHVDGHVAPVTKRSLYYPPVAAPHLNNDRLPHPETWQARGLWVLKQ